MGQDPAAPFFHSEYNLSVKTRLSGDQLMRQSSLGFIAGVVLTSLAFILFDDTAETANTGRVAQADSPAYRNLRADSPEIAAREIDSDQSAPELEADVTSLVIEVAEPPTLEELKSRQAETFEAYNDAVTEYRKALAIDRWGSAPPPAQPIPLPSEFDYLAQSPSEYHELIQREPLDPIWSANTEAQIHNYFADRPEITAKYGLPTVTCRSTRCEVAFVAYGVDDTDRAAQGGLAPEFVTGLAFRNDNADVHSEPWAEQFGYVPDAENPRILIAELNTQDGVTTILWHLRTFED